MLEVEIARAVAPWRAADLLAAMEAAGVPGGPINAVDQVLSDPQVVARGMLRRMRRADGTEVPVIGFPARLPRSPATYRRAPPRLGEDTRAVLAGELGLSGAEIDALCEAGVVEAAPAPSEIAPGETAPGETAMEGA